MDATGKNSAVKKIKDTDEIEHVLQKLRRDVA